MFLPEKVESWDEMKEKGMIKSIKQIVPAQLVNMGGIILDQPLPYRGIDQVDPFLLIHHWSHTMEGGKRQQDVGVGPHPHRGFSPVTFVFKGGVHHRDSLGISSEVFAGGVQWINSGRGIIHSERPVKELAEYGGDFEIIQLWINMPVKNKMDAPAYYPLHKNTIPKWQSDDKLISVHVVCGSFNDLKGSVNPLSEMSIFRLELKKGGRLTIPVREFDNTLLYLLDGRLNSGNENVIPKDLLIYDSHGDTVEITVVEDSNAIFLSGEPLNEPMYSHGPFVMSSQREIVQAINAYQDGEMGSLKEVFD